MMPRTESSIAASGEIRIHGDGQLLILDERLTGYNTFLTGELELDGARLTVQILTFDDVTVLRPKTHTPVLQSTGTWQGTLHLPHGSRDLVLPEDLCQALRTAGIDQAGIEAPELRHLLTYLREATTDAVRHERINAIAHALRDSRR